MKAFLLIVLLFCACSPAKNTTLIYAEQEYEKIIHQDSVICEDYIQGKLDKDGAESLLQMQHFSTEGLRLTLDGLEKLK